ncbi:MAG: hypothetical protein Q4D25_11300 [Bacteroidales bacterium]|nr:hypothetical protein [Bacteroidales bacterium]
MIRLLFIFLMLGNVAVSFSQPTPKQRHERLKIVKKVSKTKNPYIRLNDNKELTVEEFLNLSDSILWIHSYKSGDARTSHLGEKATKGVIELWTRQYADSLEQAYRREMIKLYRENEMECFFGKDEPLILFGNREISRKEYSELPEDTVAFVNFYMTDFVRGHCAPKGKGGIVYVCPRSSRSEIKYTRYISCPANGRNYLRPMLYPTPSFRDGGWYSYSPYINEKVKEYRVPISVGERAQCVVSCVIRPNGSIDPILVERIDSSKELTAEQQDKLVEASEDIIRSMPKWENSGYELVYDKLRKEYLMDVREYSVSIPITFKGN